MQTDLPIDTSLPVLVTGATGYVAGWIVKALLEAGVTVHAAVRDPDNAARRSHLDAIAAASPGTIRYFKADLLDPGSFAEAMAGCGIVFHTASPFVTQVADPQRDLVDPAVQGTRNVLEQAVRTPGVTRVVLTSSCAAIYTDAADTHDAPGGRITEDVWNTTASLDHQPYSLSKTLAEKEAWRIAEAQSQWRLVVVNPALIIGPALGDRPTSESFNIVRQMLDGTMKSGAPRFSVGAVDVRDVAAAHLAAAYLPEAEGRHIVAAEATDFVDLAGLLRDRYGADHPLPKRALPKWLFWLIGPMVAGISRRMVARNVNVPWRADNAKGRDRLGLSYRPLKPAMEEMAAQVIAAGKTG